MLATEEALFAQTVLTCSVSISNTVMIDRPGLTYKTLLLRQRSDSPARYNMSAECLLILRSRCDNALHVREYWIQRSVSVQAPWKARSCYREP